MDMSYEKKPGIKPAESIDQLADRMLRLGTYVGRERKAANYNINGDISDLLITLGQKFPSLFPEPNEPLPDESYYSKHFNKDPVIYTGLPQKAIMSIFKVEHRTGDELDFYELKVSLEYMSDNKSSYTLDIGKNSEDEGIFREIFVAENDEYGYEGQGAIFVRDFRADNEFAEIISEHVGDLVKPEK